MKRGRPPKPPEDRRPRSGPGGTTPRPLPEEAEVQQARLSTLARDVGEERWRRGLAARKPATWAELGVVLGHRSGATLQRATLAHDHPRAIRVRPATLDLWERTARAWIDGEAGRMLSRSCSS